MLRRVRRHVREVELVGLLEDRVHVRLHDLRDHRGRRLRRDRESADEGGDGDCDLHAVECSLTPAVIDLRSDTATRPSAAMREAMARAEVGDEQRREDPTVLALERAAAAFLGQAEAVYLPTASMANEIALVILGERGTELIVEETAHVMIAELGGAAVHGGLQTRGLPGYRGRLSPEQVRATARVSDGFHIPRASIVALENTHNSAGGAVWPLDELRAVVETARELGLAVHLDGARLANAAVALDVPAAEIGRLADTVTLCFSKGLGCPLGAVIAGSEELMARRTRREAPVRRRDAPGRDRRRRGRCTRSSTTSSASPTTTRGRGGSPRGGRRPASRSTPRARRRTSSRSTSARSGSRRPRRSRGSPRRGVGLSGTVVPGVLRAVTHLDVDDDDVEGALELVPAGARHPAAAPGLDPDEHAGAAALAVAASSATEARPEPHVSRATPSRSSSAGGGRPSVAITATGPRMPADERGEVVAVGGEDREDAVRAGVEVRVAALDRLGDVAVPAEERVDPRVEDEVRSGGADGAEQLDLLVDRDGRVPAHRVLDVGADDPRLPRGGDGRGRVVVAALEVGAHGDVDGGGDPRRDAEHLVAGRGAVLEPERARDGGARRRDRAAPRQPRQRDRARHVPRVREHEQPRLAVPRAEQRAPRSARAGVIPATRRTILPRRSRRRLRSNASRASASANTASICGRSAPRSARRASSTSCSRLGSTTKYVDSIPSACGGSVATETSRPPGRSSAGERCEPLPAGGVEDEVDVGARVRGRFDHAAAPRHRASWTAKPPTTPAAPWISTRSPSARRPWSKRPCHALSAGSGIAALATWPRLSGFGASTAAGTAASSAATPSRSNGVSAYTASPAATSSTPSPSASTTPESSYDGVAGRRSAGHSSSSRVIAAAWTRTRASPGAGRGGSSSSRTTDAGSPAARNRIARIPRDAINRRRRSSTTTTATAYEAEDADPLPAPRAAVGDDDADRAGRERHRRQLDVAEREREARADDPREERDHGRDEHGDLRRRRDRDLGREPHVPAVRDDDRAAVLGGVADDRDHDRGDEELARARARPRTPRASGRGAPTRAPSPPSPTASTTIATRMLHASRAACASCASRCRRRFMHGHHEVERRAAATATGTVTRKRPWRSVSPLQPGHATGRGTRATAPSTSPSWSSVERRSSSRVAAGEHGEAEHEQEVRDDRAGDRAAHDVRRARR